MKRGRSAASSPALWADRGQVFEAAVRCPALGPGLVRAQHEAAVFVRELQAGQGVEYLSPAVVEQQDAEILAAMRIPKGVHIVEETQVANENVVQLVRCGGIAHGGGQGAFDAVGAAVGEHLHATGQGRGNNWA